MYITFSWALFFSFLFFFFFLFFTNKIPGIIDCAVSANNGGSAGKGILYVLTLKDDGTVKAGMEIDPDNLSADLKDGPFAALTDTTNVPSEDRLCRSMSAPGMVAVSKETTHGFSILCGAGAHGDFGGDMWLFSFLSNGKKGGASGGKAISVVPQPTFCPQKTSSGGQRSVVAVLLLPLMLLWWW